VFLYPSILRSQNFNWINGATGSSTGNSLTVDQFGRGYIAGGFAGISQEVIFVGDDTLQAALTPELAKAFLVRYDVNSGLPQRSAYISIDNYSTKTNCPLPWNDTYVVAERIVVDRNGFISVMGVFQGCDLILFDRTGSPQLSTVTAPFTTVYQRVFLARYDSNFTPVSCHVFSSYPENHIYPGDITLTNGPSSGKLFLAVSFQGNSINTESFGSAGAPLSPYNNTFSNDPFSYDIFLAQFDIQNDQLENSTVIG